MNAIEDIWDRSQTHTEINVRYARFNIRYHIKQTQNEWK